jgi:hypothetical protein
MVARHRLGTTPREPHRTVKVLSPSFLQTSVRDGHAPASLGGVLFGRQDLGNDSVADDLVKPVRRSTYRARPALVSPMTTPRCEQTRASASANRGRASGAAEMTEASAPASSLRALSRCAAAVASAPLRRSIRSPRLTRLALSAPQSQAAFSPQDRFC